MTRNTIIAAAAVLFGVGALYAYVAPAPVNSDAPDGTWWICPNGHEVNFSVEQIGAWHKDHYGEPMHCPECDSDRLIQAARTPDGRLVPLRRDTKGDPGHPHSGPDPRVFATPDP
ncbi:MAG: hypothetical protein GC159_09690 [Phycisphaera sp.]|nr:hypothetical protein [Phycisphaera sp.]